MTDSQVIQLDLEIGPDLQGHRYFCAPMCRIWLEFYPGSIDTYNVEMFSSRETACPECRIEAMPEPERSRVRAAIAEWRERIAS